MLLLSCGTRREVKEVLSFLLRMRQSTGVVSSSFISVQHINIVLKWFIWTLSLC